MPAPRAIREEITALGLSPNKAHSADHLKRVRAAQEAALAAKKPEPEPKPVKNALVELPEPKAPEPEPAAAEAADVAPEPAAVEQATEAAPKKGRFGKKVAAKKDEPEEPPVS